MAETDMAFWEAWASRCEFADEREGSEHSGEDWQPERRLCQFSPSESFSTLACLHPCLGESLFHCRAESPL